MKLVLIMFVTSSQNPILAPLMVLGVPRVAPDLREGILGLVRRVWILVLRGRRRGVASFRRGRSETLVSHAPSLRAARKYSCEYLDCMRITIVKRNRSAAPCIYSCFVHLVTVTFRTHAKIKNGTAELRFHSARCRTPTTTHHLHQTKKTTHHLPGNLVFMSHAKHPSKRLMYTLALVLRRHQYNGRKDLFTIGLRHILFFRNSYHY